MTLEIGWRFGLVMAIFGVIFIAGIISIIILILMRISKLRSNIPQSAKNNQSKELNSETGSKINAANYFFGFLVDGIIISLLVFISTFILIQTKMINTWGNDTLHTLARYGLLLFLLSRLISRIIFKASPAEKIIRIKKINMQSILIFTICDCAIGLFVLIYILNR